jgi:hypothetical protein
MAMENQMERNVKRLEHLGRLLTGAAVVLAICIVLLVIIDFVP